MFDKSKIVKSHLAGRLATLCLTGSLLCSGGSRQCRDRPEYCCPGTGCPRLISLGSYIGQKVPTRMDDDCLNLIRLS